MDAKVHKASLSKNYGYVRKWTEDDNGHVNLGIFPYDKNINSNTNELRDINGVLFEVDAKDFQKETIRIIRSPVESSSVELPVLMKQR